ncbi:MAG: hypothetical protein RKU31_00050 [Deltaproteobacteria bacterium]
MRGVWLLVPWLAACGEAAVMTSPPDAADVVEDAGVARDAGVMGDAGVMRDAGTMRDAGMNHDAGVMRDAGVTRDAGPMTALPDPVLFVHGINGSSAEFDVMRMRLVDDGWPANRLFALDFEDPRWGCNVDNAQTIADEVARILQTTGASRIDLVAHSMGTLSSRHFLKVLGGTAQVNTYVTLGGLHHGNRLACLNPLDVCVWQELCPTNELLTNLNADPATPGDLAWVSIFSTDDGTVPVASSTLDGAENIEVSGVPHAGPGGLTEAEVVYDEVVRVLEYPAW